MKILQLSSASTFGGGERYLIDLTNELSARGHDVYVVARPHCALLHHLNLAPERIQLLPLRNALDVPSARALAKFVKTHEIDIVHAHMARDYPLAAYAARANAASRFVVTRHVLFPLNRLHRRTLAKAGRVIAVSNAVANQLRQHRIVKEEQIAVVHNGVNLSRFETAAQKFDRSKFLQDNHLPEQALLIGSVGELRTLKRHDDFIRAAAETSVRFPETHFIVAGIDSSATGVVRQRLENIAAQAGVSAQMHFPGWLENIEELLLALDVFVSASETESFGLAIAEAMAAGTPVVATETEGAQEVVARDETGLLVPIGNIQQLANAMATLIADRDKRTLMGARARDRVAERFSISRMVDRIEQIYLATLATTHQSLLPE
ncbi:MAG: glycosyltransferase family 4 protein [Pyrinomonadaceae bacterium]